jgi:hypothetical protein
MDRTDETRPAREAGDTSVEVGFNLASRVTSRESRRIPEESMESIYQHHPLILSIVEVKD